MSCRLAVDLTLTFHREITGQTEQKMTSGLSLYPTLLKLKGAFVTTEDFFQ